MKNNNKKIFCVFYRMDLAVLMRDGHFNDSGHWT